MTRYLGDADRLVGVAAALGCDLTAHPEGRAILAEALERPLELDAALAPLPQFPVHVRFVAGVRLCEAATSFAELRAPALACLLFTSKTLVGVEWGRYLAAADRLEGEVLGPDARVYLRALTQREDLWDPGNGNAMACFAPLRFPYDREACAALAAPDA